MFLVPILVPMFPPRRVLSPSVSLVPIGCFGLSDISSQPFTNIRRLRWVTCVSLSGDIPTRPINVSLIQSTNLQQRSEDSVTFIHFKYIPMMPWCVVWRQPQKRTWLQTTRDRDVHRRWSLGVCL